MLDKLISERNTATLLVYAALWLGFVVFLVAVSRAISSSNWPKASGKVVRAKIVSRKHITKSGGTTTLYDVDFAYEYIVKGTSYKSNKVRFFHTQTNSWAFPEKIATQHPEGSQVDIFYNPRNTEKSVIYPGVSKGIWMFIFSSCLRSGQ